MPHIDPERLTLLALGEPVATRDETEHLADCAVCVDDLASLRHAALAGRASIDVGELESPPEAVWTRIVDELSLGASEPAQAAAVPHASGDAAPPATAMPPADRPPIPAPATPPPRRLARRLFALAASLVIVAGLGLGVWALTQRAALTEVAEATLAPFPDHATAEGTAIVEEKPDGSLSVRVALDSDAAPDTYREVWLITADASSLVSLGVLEGDEQTFAVPAGVDLRDYVLVDVSQEPDDGDAGHSGDSIVRGELTFL